MASKKDGRSKQESEVLRHTLEGEKASVERIRQLTAELLRTADEMGTSPETLLYEINIVKVMAEEVLTMKIKGEVFSSCQGLPSEKELRERRKGMKRLRKVILSESKLMAQEMMERNGRIRTPPGGRDVNREALGPYVSAPADLRFGYIN